MKILVTNDDGVTAEGLSFLRESVADLGEVIVVAPKQVQSASALSITLRKPLALVKEGTSIYSVDGTPADCVKIACEILYQEPPDLILSGVNHGNNAGKNALYSGTLAAVIEGIFKGIRGIAFSIDQDHNPHFQPFRKELRSIIQWIIAHPAAEGTFFNVNFPSQTPSKGIRLAKQGKGFWQENIAHRSHPASEAPYYWLGAQKKHFPEEETADTYLLEQGFTTIAPLKVCDLTDYLYLQEQSSFTFDSPSHHGSETSL